MHGTGAPSPWVQRFSALIRPGGTALDVACGAGRHALWLARQGLVVTAVDRDARALQQLAQANPGIEVLQADLEGAPWPFEQTPPGRRFDAIVVTNYLWRPLLPVLLAALADDGVLIYETFAYGHQLIGKPSRPDFLLQRGELLQVCAGLRIVAFEDGHEPDVPRCVQRIAAIHAGPHALTTDRDTLAGPPGPAR